MSTDDLCHRSIPELSELLRSRQVSPVEVTAAFLDRIDRVEPEVNAFITVARDEATRAAEQAEEEMAGGEYRGTMHGIPVGIKDIYDTAGIRTTSGSKIEGDRVPTADSAVVEGLKAAGAIIIGKLMMTEFAFGEQGRNAHYGDVRNPWDLARMPGGSSTGSAASVAASECAASLGSDTGGSIRVPASLCGLVGLKPTYGLVSRRGMTPLSWSLDHAGPLARTVEGAAATLQAIAGHDPRDPTSAEMPVPNYEERLTGEVRGLRVGVLREYVWDLMDPEVEGLVRAALEQVSRLGVEIEEVSVPRLEDIGLVMSTLIPADAAAVHRETVLKRGADYDPVTRNHIESGLFVTAADYSKANRLRALLNRDMAGVLERVDFLMVPTCPVTAPSYAAPVVALGGEEFPSRMVLSRITRAFNPNGLPAVSVPCGFSSEGLPAGVQVVGRAFDDAGVLNLAFAYEQAAGWHTRRAPLE